MLKAVVGPNRMSTEFPEEDREENELMLVQSVVGELVKAVLSRMIG